MKSVFYGSAVRFSTGNDLMIVLEREYLNHATAL